MVLIHQVEIKNWKAFLQQAVRLISSGYDYYHLVTYPERKKDRWEWIDKKLTEKYQVTTNKFKAYRNKRKGIPNTRVIRYGSTCLILRTSDDVRGVGDPDPFTTILSTKLRVKISDSLEFEIYKEERGGKWHTTVRLSRDTYDRIKTEIYENIRKGELRMAQESFNRLNELPAYRGIIVQKMNLRKATLAYGKKKRRRIKGSTLKIHTFRKVYRVYGAENGELEPRSPGSPFLE